MKCEDPAWKELKNDWKWVELRRAILNSSDWIIYIPLHICSTFRGFYSCRFDSFLTKRRREKKWRTEKRRSHVFVQHSKRVTRRDLIAQLTAQWWKAKGLAFIGTGGKKWKWKFSLSFSRRACLCGFSIPFLRKFQIVSNDNQTQYLPFVSVLNGNWKCLFVAWTAWDFFAEISVSANEEILPEMFDISVTTRRTKKSWKKCQISLPKGHSTVFCSVCVTRLLLWDIFPRHECSQKPDWPQCVDKVIIALTMYDTFYKPN